MILALFLLSPALFGQSFVQRSGTHLVLEGKPFRFSGPNLEWLGLEGYGPHDPAGPHYASHFEIDDAFATAEEMGARVVRSQTIGDTVGCALCVEPAPGRFNEAGFQASDYAIAAAAKHHLRLIVSLIGDCATCSGGGIGQVLAWNHAADPQAFFNDPTILAAFERHIDAVLDHRNALTGVRYRDDPTILAWENCNMCGLYPLLSHGSLAEVAHWSEAVGAHVKSLAPRQLFLDTSGIFRVYPAILENPSTDLVAFEEYPHWDPVFNKLAGLSATTVETIRADAATVTRHGKAFIVNEFGWDRTNWKTAEELQGLLEVMQKDANFSGDLFWALQAHLDEFGFQPIPADSHDPQFAGVGECGEWWALYYPGIKTLVMPAEEMASRAQQLRAHAYAMTGVPVPAHARPPAPVITSIVLGGLVAWRGSAGAVRYSVERYDTAGKRWETVCDKCATDMDDPWADPQGAPIGGRYRVTAFNADGVASEVSEPR